MLTGMFTSQFSRFHYYAVIAAAALQPRLKSPGLHGRADAAAMLQQYGSPLAEAPLWQALERWHERWKDQAAKLEKDQRSSDGMPWKEAVERDLTSALMGGTAWVMSESSARRLTALCVTGDCRQSVEQQFQYPESNPSITVHAPALPRGEPTLFNDLSLVPPVLTDYSLATFQLFFKDSRNTYLVGGTIAALSVVEPTPPTPPAVPEPASLVLLATGLAGLAASRTRGSK